MQNKINTWHVTTLNPCHGGRDRAKRGGRDLRQDLRRLSLTSLNLSWRRRWRAWRRLPCHSCQRWISLWSCTRRRWSSWGTRCAREGGQAQSLNRTNRTLSEAFLKYCASSGPQHMPGNISLKEYILYFFVVYIHVVWSITYKSLSIFDPSYMPQRPSLQPFWARCGGYLNVSVLAPRSIFLTLRSSTLHFPYWHTERSREEASKWVTHLISGTYILLLNSSLFPCYLTITFLRM